MTDRSSKLRVLHVFMRIGATSGQYNEHCLPMATRRTIGICSVLPPDLTPPDEITVFAGDGTARGFRRALSRALEQPWDVIHVHAAAAAALALPVLLLKRRSMANTVYTIQNSYGNYRRRNQLLLYPIVALFRRIVICSAAARDTLPRAMRLLAGKRLHVIPNAVDLDRVDRVTEGAGSAATQPEDRFRVVSVGRVIKIKDPVALVRAFGSAVNGHPDELLYVGTGDLEDSVRTAAAEIGLNGRVQITGLVGRDDVYRHLVTGSVFVSTSHGEGMPVAVLEAMAAGRPVVLSDIEPHREIARGNDVVPLIPIGDVAGFAAQIERFRAMSPDERSSVGAACRAIVEERFGLPAMTAAYERVYGEVVTRELQRRRNGGAS